MELSPYVESLRRDLLGTAAVGGPDVARAADLLAGALEPAVRLVLLDVLTAAATEIGEVVGADAQVRMRGREPEIVVDRAKEPDPVEIDSDEDTSRVTLRLPESLKQAAERAAIGRGLSVNAFLVAAVKRELDARPTHSPAGGYRLSGYARA